MIAVILSGHGAFASGMAKAVEQITGSHPQFGALDFPEDKSTEQLEGEMRSAIRDLDSGDGVVFLTDILGGTPFRTASLLSFEYPNIEVITGTNLQIAAEMLLERDGLTPAEFASMALECGRRGLTSFALEHQARQAEDEGDMDGL